MNRSFLRDADKCRDSVATVAATVLGGGNRAAGPLFLAILEAAENSHSDPAGLDQGSTEDRGGGEGAGGPPKGGPRATRQSPPLGLASNMDAMSRVEDAAN